MAEVARLIADRARQQPADPAYVTAADGRVLTWRGLADYADRMATLARERHLPPSARIGLVAGDPLSFTSAYLGALAAGRTAVPIDPRLTPAELAATAARLRVDVLLSDGPAMPDLRGPEIWDATPFRVRAKQSEAWPSAGAAARPAVLLTSSGTTGNPKGIGLSEWQVLDAARRVARHHRFGPAERGYNPLPLFHVNAQVMGLLATLVSGASLILDRRFEPGAYWDRVAQWKPTWLNAVPAVLAALANRPGPPESVAAGIRFARSASAPLPVATARAFAERTGVAILETYGMTEAAGQITANPLDPAARRSGSVGLPVGVELAVLGADGRPAGPGEQGMVALRGPQVAAHYLIFETEGAKGAEGAETDRPARDANGWLPTGDLGTRDEDGFVYLAGRADDVINRGGEKVFPQEVEDVLLAHPGVLSAAVVAAPHDRLGQVPVAFVTAGPGSDDGRLVEALHRLCTERLARYKRPAGITVTTALPTGPTGKVLRRRLRSAR
jgi:acyl-CoA synthetase (AMP-forming)/AMP-acid ligase II